MYRKSPICVGKVSRQPLTEYDSEAAALEGVRHAPERHGTHNVAYRCQKCGGWHLSPVERQTPSVTCGVCCGQDGRPKATYASERDAERRAEILLRERGVVLRAYACEHGGWHLTKTWRGRGGRRSLAISWRRCPSRGCASGRCACR